MGMNLKTPCSTKRHLQFVAAIFGPQDKSTVACSALACSNTKKKTQMETNVYVTFTGMYETDTESILVLVK